MKYSLRYLFIMAVAAMCSLHCYADEATPNDTVYFYDTWQQLFDHEPMGFSVTPPLYALTPYEVYFDTGDYDLDEMMLRNHLAMSLGDSIMLMSSQYLKKNFKGDAKSLEGFVPVYFNEKTAFLTFQSMSLRDILFGKSLNDEETKYTVEFYYIDFVKREVKKVTPSYLSELLEDYHDLQMRYEGMKDYKKQYIIQDYFYKYVDRATRDFMRPYILDLVENISVE